jgi:hypothetical protein
MVYSLDTSTSRNGAAVGGSANTVDVLLPRRSLQVQSGRVRYTYRHGIPNEVRYHDIIALPPKTNGKSLMSLIVRMRINSNTVVVLELAWKETGVNHIPAKQVPKIQCLNRTSAFRGHISPTCSPRHKHIARCADQKSGLAESFLIVFCTTGLQKAAEPIEHHGCARKVGRPRVMLSVSGWRLGPFRSPLPPPMHPD